MTTETWLDEDTTWFSNETDADRGDNSTSIVDAVGLNSVDSFVKALTAMLVSELGDKTFFLAAILSMRYNKLTIFLGSIVSLIVMTVISALVGFGITSFIPPVYTFYAAIVIMFLFGLKMFWDAYRMKPDEGEQLQQEVEDQVDNLNKKMSGKGNSVENLSYSSSDGLSQSQADVSGKSDASKQLVNQLFTSIQFWKSSKPTNTPPGPLKKATSTTALTPPAAKDSKSVEEGREDSPEQPQTSKQKFLALLKIFVNTFGLIFIAEWGDRSQLATIVLASVNNVGGIILGAIVGHVICTSLAVIAGALVARWISVRVVTVIGGCVFIGFAIASLVIGFEDPATVVDSI